MTTTLRRVCLASALLLLAPVCRAELPVLHVYMGAQTSQPAPPYYWPDTCSGQLRGIVPHLTKRLVEDLGYQLEYYAAEGETNFEDNQRERRRDLLEGKTDFVILAAINAEDKEVLYSKASLIKLQSEILYRKELGPITELAQLRNFRGIASNATRNAAYAPLIAQLPKLEFKSEARRYLGELATGTLDFIILDHHIASLHIYQLRLQDKVDRLPIEDYARLAVAVKKGGPLEALLPRIEQLLSGYQDSGLVNHLANTYVTTWVRDKQCASHRNAE